MSLTVQLSYPPSEDPPSTGDEAALIRAAAAKLGLAPDAIAAARPAKVSFDARRRHRVWRISVNVWLEGDEIPDAPRTSPPDIGRPAADASHVVVIGTGPAGMFCALELLAAGIAVTLVERGRDVQTRRKPIARIQRGEPADPDCNYCFGEGGAGTYSDGKLYTRSGKKPEIRRVLETLVEHGAPTEILSSWRPHVGSNRLPEVVASIRETILRAGGKVRFGCRAEQIETAPAPTQTPTQTHVVAVAVRDLDTDQLERMPCDAAVLATGHSALDAVQMAAAAGAPLEAKGFAMGIRIEHAQPWLDERQYGGLRDGCELPASFYELRTQVEERGVYSFCMCPGGFIVPTSTAGGRVVLNGMSLSRRDSPYANSGLVVAVEPEDWCGERGAQWGFDALLARARKAGAPFLPPGDALPITPDNDPLFGVRLQLALETLAGTLGGGRGRAPSQRADLVASGATDPGPALPTSYRPGVTPCDLAQLLPVGLYSRLRRSLAEFDTHIPGFASEHGQLEGVETRTSSPVRVTRDPETLQSPGVAGLYPSGEGAGFAGGIVSAALDGRRVAAAIRTALPQRN